MLERNRLLTIVFAVMFALTAASCASSRSRTETKAAGATAGSPPAGMNANGEVVNSSQIQAGSGQEVKGINDWEGEITGKPAPNSKFTKLQIGMSTKQVTDLIGQPDDQGTYLTGKSFVPFYFGSDRYRYEFVYKGQGRLVFAGGSMGDFQSGNLIWIIHNTNEGPYR